MNSDVVARTADQPLVRSLNRLRIMDALRANGAVSRVEIGERTGLAPATTSEITAALLAEGLLRESRVVAAGRGRPRSCWRSTPRPAGSWASSSPPIA